MASKDRLVGYVLGGATLAALGVLFIAMSLASEPEPAAPDGGAPAGEHDLTFEASAVPKAATQLLGGLAPGDELLGWKVAYIAVMEDKRLEVRMAKGPQAFAVWLRKGAAADKVPPKKTETYALYVGNGIVAGDAGPIDADAANGILEEIFERVKNNEANAPVPPGM